MELGVCGPDGTTFGEAHHHADRIRYYQSHARRGVGKLPFKMPDRSVPFYEVLGDETGWLFDDCGGKTPPDILGYVGTEIPDTDLQPEPETQTCRRPYPVFQGSGKCFCLRKGSGNAADCPRCDGTGECSHRKVTGP